MQPLVDGRRQAERFYQLMHKTDASIRRGHRSLRHFILNVSAPENGLLQIVREIKLVQPFNDSSLACPTSTCHNSVHSKSLRDCDGSVCEHKSNTAKRRRISSFLFSFANSANGYAFLRARDYDKLSDRERYLWDICLFAALTDGRGNVPDFFRPPQGAHA